MLIKLADLIRRTVQDEDFIGRHAGDEFVLTIKNVDPAFIAEAIRSRVESELAITVSVGYCSLSPALHSAELLLLAAKMAVNQAKAGGRNRIRMFHGFDEGISEQELKSFLQQGSYSAVRALAEAVDAKDAYTRGHSARVAFYAKELAKLQGYDSGFIDLVFVTGTLHDVGKIGVPDVALKKEGKLTDEEFEMIKLHPELGEKIVGQIPQLHDTLEGIRNHHERWDGRGYPDKLAGENIPLIARILAVADTFDAMTSDRPYRKGLDIRIAQAEIEKCAGQQFDPSLALTFATYLNEFATVDELLHSEERKVA